MFSTIMRLFGLRKSRRKTVVYVLAASDRFNYGDLLFPYIVRHYIGAKADEMHFVSTTASDLSERGALPTEAFEVLTRMSPDVRNVLIVAGGECLFSGWPDIMEYVGRDADSVPHPTRYPYTIGKKELPHLNAVVYNSVSCTALYTIIDLRRNQWNKEVLRSADYIAVRDSMTSKGLWKMMQWHRLCPDSAIMMGEVFSKAFLQQKTAPRIKAIRSHRYVFFQIGLRYLGDHAAQLAAMLKYIALSQEVHICLCPIGTAPGHDDQKALAEIAQLLPEDIYTLVDEPSIWDIMNLIRGARIYIGSSLHGAITAMSFRVPLIGFGSDKLKAYIATWYDNDKYEPSFTDIDRLPDAAVRRLISQVYEDPRKQKRRMRRSLNRIKKFL